MISITTESCEISYPVGNAFTGVLVVTLSESFEYIEDDTTKSVTAGLQATIPIVDGVFVSSPSLAPTSGAGNSKKVFYIAQLYKNGKLLSQQYWLLPYSLGDSVEYTDIQLANPGGKQPYIPVPFGGNNSSGSGSVDLSGYATEIWVGNQGYLTETALATALAEYATQDWVTEQIGELEFLTADDLDGYATEQWVEDNFAKLEDMDDVEPMSAIELYWSAAVLRTTLENGLVTSFTDVAWTQINLGQNEDTNPWEKKETANSVINFNDDGSITNNSAYEVEVRCVFSGITASNWLLVGFVDEDGNSLASTELYSSDGFCLDKTITMAAGSTIKVAMYPTDSSSSTIDLYQYTLSAVVLPDYMKLSSGTKEYAPGYRYNYSKAIAGAPSAGYVEFDATTLANISNMYIHTTTQVSTMDIAAVLSGVAVGDYITLFAAESRTKNLVLKVTAAPSTTDSVCTIGVSVVYQSGTFYAENLFVIDITHAGNSSKLIWKYSSEKTPAEGCFTESHAVGNYTAYLHLTNAAAINTNRYFTGLNSTAGIMLESLCGNYHLRGTIENFAKDTDTSIVELTGGTSDVSMSDVPDGTVFELMVNYGYSSGGGATYIVAGNISVSSSTTYKRVGALSLTAGTYTFSALIDNTSGMYVKLYNVTGVTEISETEITATYPVTTEDEFTIESDAIVELWAKGTGQILTATIE